MLGITEPTIQELFEKIFFIPGSGVVVCCPDIQWKCYSFIFTTSSLKSWTMKGCPELFVCDPVLTCTVSTLHTTFTESLM